MAKVEGVVLTKVNFPLYTIQMVTSHHVLVGGGGGSAKTGVANGFELFELSHDGKQFYVEDKVRHDTGDNVVMNCDVHSNGKNIYVVAGQENSNQLYKITAEFTQMNGVVKSKESNNTADTIVRKRKEKDKENAKQKGGKKEKSNEKGKNKKDKIEDPPILNSIDSKEKNLRFGFKTFDSVQTVFAGSESLQRVVRLSRNGDLMVTGGTDGHLRLWSFPKMKPLLHIEAHSKEIDDVDFSISGEQIVSIAKDGKAFVWNSKNGSLSKELKWNTPDNIKYLFKRCRYGLVEDSPKRSRLFTLANPLAQNKRGISYVQQWDVDSGRLRLAREMKESLSALAVRDDGRFVAVGTMFTGSVFVYIAFSLQSLSALAVRDDGRFVAVGTMFTGSVFVYIAFSLQFTGTISVSFALLLVFVVVLLTFALLTFLGL
ncbi:prolactin regulatory element-binding protein [Diaphorina citri]|uniref:Prolactin regulatory element-binding protein n=1 Tax=Diaphorina citri TaxID=121845 RepID=A0A3Q0J7U4_DIACI|nr:prolactin regulatory element-binding protein [Diaphorina citri]